MLDNSSLDSISFSNSSPENLPSFEDATPTRKLSQCKFTIYEAYSASNRMSLAIKAFPCIDSNSLHPAYLNEARLLHLNHSNIIQILDISDHNNIQNRDCSLVFMELAVCDFVDLFQKHDFFWDDKLVRTFFHQLIDGLEYLHMNGISHMDLKTENLLLGSDSKLKIADFDLSHKTGEKVIRGQGTANFRAPELLTRRIRNPKKTDIYSVGIILFVLRFGYLPYREFDLIDGHDLFEMMLESPEEFWKIHKQMNPSDFKAEDGFKELFFGLVAKNSDKRLDFKQIRENTWYQGPVFSQSEMIKMMKF